MANEKWQKDKQRSTQHTHKTKDRVSPGVKYIFKNISQITEKIFYNDNVESVGKSFMCMLRRSLFILLSFFFGHCVVSFPFFAIYGFWLPLW
jgi:hypothetical protein